ncbi:MAG: GGDEF domain-containing protein [Lachnospiraceae bacterium]|jgi:diguanylate cyclase (GGDEF)-like protein|nr:GGDEF domain-containing protein [Lachnospiraceae bacterium]MBR3484566.1 GGDEF domain-containing protein [Lachnospiraceae bacterium]MBR3580117.1 GGDEF domain-containing protein [Lachnospiraceae bacterium]
MGERLRRQENMRVLARLSLENIRRAFFTAAVCAGLIPVLLVINIISLGDQTVGGILTGMFIACEILDIIFTGVAFFAMKNRDDELSLKTYRMFWIFFELFSFLLIYANKLAGTGSTFYSVMLIVLMLVPALEPMEMMYGIAAEAVYILFLFVRFGTNGFEVFNILLMNVLLYLMSRYLFKHTIEHIRLKERVKDSDGGADIDKMTGLLSRKGFERRAYQSIMASVRARKRFSILMIDIDGLQAYNNEYGTKRGDSLICAIGELIRSAVVKNTDIVARLDGGKFIVCMDGAHGKDDEKLAGKVKEYIDRKRIPGAKDRKNRFVTVSIGVATTMPTVDNDYYELYDAAEDSMFAAKDMGGDAIVSDNETYEKKNINRPAAAIVG